MKLAYLCQERPEFLAFEGHKGRKAKKGYLPPFLLLHLFLFLFVFTHWTNPDGRRPTRTNQTDPDGRRPTRTNQTDPDQPRPTQTDPDQPNRPGPTQMDLDRPGWIISLGSLVLPLMTILFHFSMAACSANLFILFFKFLPHHNCFVNFPNINTCLKELWGPWDLTLLWEKGKPI